MSVRLSIMGLNTATGDQPFALFGAAETGLAQFVPHPVLTAPAASGEDMEAVMVSPVVDPEVDDCAVRCAMLAVPVLAEVSRCPFDGVEWHLVLPEQGTPRGEALGEGGVEEMMADAIGPALPLHVHHVEGGIMELMQDWYRRVEQEQAGAVGVLAVDTLIDEVTCHDLALAGDLCTVRGVGGVIPGEAAVLLLLSPANAGPRPGLASAILRSVEPAGGEGESRSASSVEAAAKRAWQAAGIDPSGVDVMVHPFAGSPRDAMFWHALRSRIYPAAADDGAREAAGRGDTPAPTEVVFRDPPALSSAAVVGHTGVAELPVALALAVARMEFHPPAVDRIAVVEGAAPGGVVLLESESASQSRSDGSGAEEREHAA